MHAEDEQSITLKVENDVLKVIQKKDIEGKIQIQDKSMMPEGLANNMTVQDFRDLIRYPDGPSLRDGRRHRCIRVGSDR